MTMEQPRDDLVTSVAELHSLLLSTETMEEFLQELAVVAARDVRDGLSCGITLRSQGLPRTVASSDTLAAQLDEVQYGFDDGPCLHAMRHEHTVQVDDTADDARWGGFAIRAAAHGVRSCLALPLVADGRNAGALNLYAQETQAFGPPETRRAELVAQNASGALAMALRLASCVALTEQLQASLASRLVIDRAIGVIIARERCTQREAFEVLRSTSQNRNIKLREIAASVVASVRGEPPEAAPFEFG
jgi:GAF domain-containing protein